LHLCGVKKWNILKYMVGGTWLLVLVLQVFSKPLLVADYYLQTQTYLANCVNKAKPQLKCKGKCQLMMKMAEDQKKNEPTKVEETVTIVLSTKSFFPVVVSPTITKITNITSRYQSSLSIGVQTSIFQPPRPALA
jgi:hypothetical protein